ncbi:MAG: PQQ-dependent sugar dehydrogenase, partial [Gaiellaceae bacterium]
GKRRPKPFLDVSSRVGSAPEQGLFSIAFHPRYPTNRKLYVNYADANGNTRVVEYRANARRVLKRSARQILWVRQSEPNHNGGQLAFGPQGHLYVGMGDGGGPGDPDDNAQDDSSRLGNLLQLDVDRDGASWATAGYGLRNPWRFSFDAQTGDLYLSDVGQESVEEINFTPRYSPGVENYGWDVYEGHARFDDKPVNRRGRLVMPIAGYTHALGCSVTGGFVYRGKRIPAARGRYFYGDFCTGRVWSMRVRDGEATSQRRERFKVPELVSFGEDGRGELYLVSRRGSVFRMVKR